jgi:hypothetical protein
MLVGGIAASRPPQSSRARRAVAASLVRGGRTVQRDETPVTGPAEIRALVTEAVRLTLAHVPLLREPGTLTGESAARPAAV